MRLPTPVMSRANRIDSGSISKPASIVLLPVLIHVYSGTETARCASGRPSRSANRATDEPPLVPHVEDRDDEQEHEDEDDLDQNYPPRVVPEDRHGRPPSLAVTGSPARAPSVSATFRPDAREGIHTTPSTTVSSITAS